MRRKDAAMQSSDSRDTRNSYVIDIENAAETARLLDQDYLFTKAMGGLFPEEPDLDNVARILDIACGPGGWACEVAFRYPDIEVVGVDINENVVKYARAMAKVQQLQNVSFEVMDVKQPLNFPDESFDMVNGRFIIGFMDKASWPTLLRECRRILRPGGIIRLSEAEMMITNSLAFQQLWGYLFQVLALQGRSFSVDGRSFGIAHILRKLFQDERFEQTGTRSYMLNASTGDDLHYSYCKDAELAMALLKPYILKSGVVGDVEYEELYRQMLIDMRRDDFLCTVFGLTAWGKKPAQS
jgi:ubiquinone/menaquinone biosynthesis C-methylase UbiE